MGEKTSKEGQPRHGQVQQRARNRGRGRESCLRHDHARLQKVVQGNGESSPASSPPPELHLANRDDDLFVAPSTASSTAPSVASACGWIPERRVSAAYCLWQSLALVPSGSRKSKSSLSGQ